MKKWLGWVSFGIIALVNSVALAEESAAAAGGSDHAKMALAIAAGIGMSIASFGGAIGQARAISTAVDGVARNPGAAGKIFAPTLIIGLALIESLVLFTLAIAYLLQSKI